MADTINETKKRGRGRPPLPPEQKRKADPTDLTPPSVGPNALQNIEPGDNNKYLAHALAVRNMPAIDTRDPVQVKQRIDDYFALCVAHDMKPTVKGFLNSLRVARSTLWEWKQGNFRAGTHQQIICDAYDVLEELWEGYMMNGKINPVSGIFLAKNNFGYSDKQEYVLTPNTGMPEAADPKLIEAKYAELPDSDEL